MEKIVLFVILACLFSCSSSELGKPKKCIEMNISNAVPVQFWINGEESYNQKDVCGITPVCFCQPFECNDEILIRFTTISLMQYYLSVLNSTGTEIQTIDFSEDNINSTTSIYSVSFTPSDYDLCDDQISFQIKRVYQSSPIVNPGFDTVITPWQQESTGSTWSMFGPSAIQETNSPSKIVFQNVRLEDTTYTLSYDNGRSVSFGTAIVTVGLEDINGNTLSTFTIPNGSGTTTFQGYIGGVQVAKIQFRAGGTFLGSVTMRLFDATTPNVGDQLIAYSDCISIKNTHPCTTLVTYSNANDFDGISFTSPIQSYNLRIPAIFFEEQNTKEGEDIELSNDEIVRLYDKIEEKRLLQIGFMPHYMHRKLLLALSFDFVTIDGKEWIVRDEYKKNDGDRHYPLKTASILLTDKNFIKENQL